ncbi:MAG: hypothetical protein ACFFAQ_10865 [Promethearchaeota archaeon]
MKIRKILIVCTGNAARSPVGSYLGQFYSEKYNANLVFDSAGFINAFSTILPESQVFLDSKGINYSDFKPKIINKKLLEKQDLIITMERHHANQIKSNFNNIKDIDNKTFTLREFNGEITDLDILDPYYTNKETYYKVLIQIDENIEELVKKVIIINQKDK